MKLKTEGSFDRTWTEYFQLRGRTTRCCPGDQGAYETCNTSSTIRVWSTSPGKILINSTGDYFFTSTYPRHCILGQQLAIRVVSSSGTTDHGTAPSSSIAGPPSSSSTGSPVTEGPATSPPPASSSSSRVIAGFFIALVSIAMAVF
ncbi:hypothetical protein GH714_015126 [Hevea brasiliensis]|uniref:Phytocyanin domain-containing protein n=1 Tax=Hevea brasiliensis TaxID=3981 RepID=A0A6A6MA59_HEVBR|nr:hypothetical protein GH714_015126 [Hevea brasiliensis]